MTGPVETCRNELALVLCVLKVSAHSRDFQTDKTLTDRIMR